MHVAQFVHRYPPALGGAEAYAARLCEYLAGRGDDVSRVDDDGGRAGGVLANSDEREDRRSSALGVSDCRE